jgi:2-dehydro-3-deoxyphosphogluconate aldolase/(4S)-4-hydroxy-2-oxoglutarate aldolase
MGNQTEDMGFRVAHIGINCSEEIKAAQAAALFSDIFGFSVKDGNSSVFAGKEIELMKTPGYGAKGHIAVQTKNIEGAVALLRQKGVEFIMDSVLRNKEGEMVRIFLENEIEGFAIHLLKV